MSFSPSCVIMDFLCGLHLLQLGTDSAVGVAGPSFFLPSLPPSLFTVPTPLCLFLIFLLMPRLECPWLRPLEPRPSLQVKTHACTGLAYLCLDAPQVDWSHSDQFWWCSYVSPHLPSDTHSQIMQLLLRLFLLDRFF